MDQCSLITHLAARDLVAFDLMHISFIGKQAQFVGTFHHNDLGKFFLCVVTDTPKCGRIQTFGISKTIKTDAHIFHFHFFDISLCHIIGKFRAPLSCKHFFVAAKSCLYHFVQFFRIGKDFFVFFNIFKKRFIFLVQLQNLKSY